MFLGLSAVIAGIWFAHLSPESTIKDDYLGRRSYEEKVTVVEGTIKTMTPYHDPTVGGTSFWLVLDKGKKVKVICPCFNPKDFKDGSVVIIEGSYTVEQVLMAKRIWKKQNEF